MKKENITINVVHKNDVYNFNKFSQLEKFISNISDEVKELEDVIEEILMNEYLESINAKDHLKKFFMDRIKFLSKIVITIGKIIK